jgi:hypothetical protein
METWYVLEDDRVADPRDVVRGADGLLRHKDGRKVAYLPYGPRSRSVNPVTERAKSAPDPKQAAKEAKPAEPKTGYVTRETKAEK